MKPLKLPSCLLNEFATVQAVIGSDGSTRRVDALLLTWVKHEKQLRRLFCFLVFQHASVVGDRYSELSVELDRIRAYRNKLMHGQITGQRISSLTIERDVKILVDWIVALAAGANLRFGYDGITRNTYRAAKESSKIAVSSYPFTNSDEFKKWLTKLTH
jgi:hypothetical protein